MTISTCLIKQINSQLRVCLPCSLAFLSTPRIAWQNVITNLGSKDVSTSLSTLIRRNIIDVIIRQIAKCLVLRLVSICKFFC
jgi:hypothetical protein